MSNHLMSLHIVTLAIFVLAPVLSEAGLLYPKPSETRETISLDGIWNFVASPLTDSQIGFRNQWYKNPLARVVDYEVHLMPVPSSYNDITQNPEIRDHLGTVWYDRTFFVPESWRDKRVWIRFSSVNYAAQVYINGELVMSHELGHLPFQGEVTSSVVFGSENRISVACDNTLTSTTVPQGTVSDVETENGFVPRQSYTFDFFNYAGIHRPVILYTTPNSYIDDITVNTDVDDDGTGYVDYDIGLIQVDDVEVSVSVTLLDAEDAIAATGTGATGTLSVASANLWWPYLMDDNPGYLYTLQVELVSSDGDIIDTYRQPIGIRTLTWSDTAFLINNIPLYLFGFGRHEDSDIRGRGLDLPTVVRDYNLLKWIGANAYRTSHYPYADEIMDLADQLGIMIIDECPGVNIEISFGTLMDNHKTSLTDLIARDKNRPSVISWSIANEPSTNTPEIGDYFGEIADHVRSLDTSRPITLALTSFPEEDYAGQHLDLISFNRYYGWYHDAGQLDRIKVSLTQEATAWYEKYNKPVIMTEYGADTMEGLHLSPAYIWSEEYQVEFMSKHFEVFDELRQSFLIGEFIWNFADFKTAQNYIRVGGNKKGVFTRNRQPKASAHHLRRRYLQLANELYGIDLPDDLYDYTISSSTRRDEL